MMFEINQIQQCGEPGIGEYSNVPELKAQWFYRFLHETYVWHTLGLGALLYMLGGFPYVAWGMVYTFVICLLDCSHKTVTSFIYLKTKLSKLYFWSI